MGTLGQVRVRTHVSTELHKPPALLPKKHPKSHWNMTHIQCGGQPVSLTSVRTVSITINGHRGLRSFEYEAHRPTECPTLCQRLINFVVKGKGKAHPITEHKGPKERRYSSALSSASELDGVGGYRDVPTAFTTEKESRYQLYGGGPPGRSGRVRKISPLLGFDLRTAQSVASRCTDWATPVHMDLVVRKKSKKEWGGGYKQMWRKRI
jgi:hypothetical protein